MSGRIGENELKEINNLISNKIIPELVRIADKYNYDRDSLIKFVANIFLNMAELSTFENFNRAESEDKR
jgi:hypothetical protein